AAARVLQRQPEILAGDAEAESRQAAEERDDQHERGVPENGHVPREPADEDGHARDEAERRAQDAQNQQRANRQIREGENAVERVADLAFERPRAAALDARAALVPHERPPETEPEEQCDEVGVDVLQTLELVAKRAAAPELIGPTLRPVEEHRTPVPLPHL